jgi:hypothetical protein
MPLPPVLLRIDRDDSTGCWNWTATIRNGYPVMQWKGKPCGAHRIFAHMFLGFPLDNRLVCHRCDNPKCVNPAHLFIGTNEDNMRDMREKGRNRPRSSTTECPAGHPYNPQNTTYNSKGYKFCKLCNRNRNRERYADRIGRPVRPYKSQTPR